jgi:cytochrome c biogenesis protein CcdA
MVIGDILPLALVVTISPLNIIPSILLLFTSRPLANATSFLVGFIMGVATLLALFVAIAGAVNLSAESGHSTWAGTLKLVLGAYLVVAAVRKFRGRPRAGEQGSMPKWMGGIAGYTPAKALGAGGILGALNPKNLVVALAAAAAIAAGGLSVGRQFVAGVIYVFIGAIGVAAPILTMLLLGSRAPKVLDEWNDWLRQNNASVMSVLFLVFGVVLIGRGIAGV